MPKRLISSEILIDEDLMEAGASVALLYIGIIVNADDYGLHPARAAIVSNRVWLLGQHTIEETRDMLDFLERKEKLIKFTSRGTEYYALRSWFNVQVLTHPKALTVEVPPEVVDRLAEAAKKDPDRVYRAFRVDPQWKKSAIGRAVTPLRVVNGADEVEPF
jgi:predicted TIM-barrel fold metal-dependent hydrolase